MKVFIRAMALEDAEAVNRLSKQLGYTLPVADTFTNIERLLPMPNNCCFVAVHNSGVIGWIHGLISVQIESKPFAVIGGLVVDENFRSKGIGRALINQVKEWSVKAGVSTLRVRSNVKRTEAHRFYENLGFSVTKEQKVFEMRIVKQ